MVTFAEVAAGLRRLAEDMEALAGSGVPVPNVTVLVGGLDRAGGARVGDEGKRACVDAVAVALLGQRGVTNRFGSRWVHAASGDRPDGGFLSVSEYVADPTASVEVELRAEVARLRAELAGRGAGPDGGSGEVMVTAVCPACATGWHGGCGSDLAGVGCACVCPVGAGTGVRS
ncbi:MAG: hypothetical protein HYR62_08915 [Actinobacteria bacterium]|nr:hypothetical protein [Actinomycetota bacterium]MBI3688563.1 hypothetical protein [Actinomycetota bacterium]